MTPCNTSVKKVLRKIERKRKSWSETKRASLTQCCASLKHRTSCSMGWHQWALWVCLGSSTEGVWWQHTPDCQHVNTQQICMANGCSVTLCPRQSYIGCGSPICTHLTNKATVPWWFIQHATVRCHEAAEPHGTSLWSLKDSWRWNMRCLRITPSEVILVYSYVH